MLLCLPALLCRPAAAEPVTVGQRAQIEDARFESLKTVDYPTSQRPVESLDAAINEAGNDPAKLAAIEARLAALLEDPAATFAARQAICQRLGFVLGPAQSGAHPALPVLAKMLTDEKQVELARLALDPVPGAAVDALFLDALRRTDGKTRLALIHSAGNRRIADAVAILAPWLKEPDPVTAAVVAAALGRIGTLLDSRAAEQALLTAPEPSARVVVDARLDCARRLSPREADEVFQSVFADAGVGPAQRAAALRGLLDTRPGSAVRRILEVLAGDNAAFKQVAIEAIVSLPAKNAADEIAARLDTLDAPAQAAVIAALGRRGATGVVPAIVAALSHPEPAVRLAAIDALGRLPGNGDIAARLARLGAGSSDEAKAARLSLSRLNGPGVADTVITGAEKGEPALRLVFLEQLAWRNMTGALPLLLKTRNDPDARVRAAALDALGTIAPPQEQRAILDWTVHAADSQEQSRAVRALISVTLRQPDVAGRAQAVVAAIDQNGPAVKRRLLPALPRLGGEAALDCAARLARHEDPAVADAATDALVRWPDSAALKPLVTVAEKTSRDDLRATAVQGAVRRLERGRELSSPGQADALDRLLAVTRDPDVRKKLVFLLGRCADDRALALAERLQVDAALAAEARDAAMAIRANQVWPPVLTASGSADQLKNAMDGKADTRWSVPARAGQWIQLDFKLVRPIRRITLDQGSRGSEFPEHYEVYVTDDPPAPGAALVGGAGQRGKTVIELPAGTHGRCVLIKNTGERDDSSWSIAEFLLD